MRRSWSEEEEKFLKGNYFLKSSFDIANILNRTARAVVVKACKIGLHKKRSSLWTDGEIIFLQENYKDMAYSEIGDILNRSYKAISAKAVKFGLKRCVSRLWTDEEEKYLVENCDKTPLIKMVIYLDRSYTAISKRLSFLGLKSGFKYHRPKYNEKFFDVWSPELAWLVGIMLSDGHISSNFRCGSKFVNIRMCDKDVVEKVKKIIQYKGKVRFCKREQLQYKDSYIIVVYGNAIWQFFIDLGMDNHKSYTAKWPVGLPDEYVSHFLRGLFDGDGSISFGKKGYPFARICGTESVIKSVVKYVGLHYTIHPSKNSYIVQYTGVRAKDFLNFIYKDSTENIRMDRKYKKYLEL